MNTIRIKDRDFAISFTQEEIRKRVKCVAAEIRRDMGGRKPLFLCVLNGAFVFAADLVRMVGIECQISFVRLSSYSGTDSSGQVRELIGLDESVEGRHVIVVEDIVDTGLTMAHTLETLRAMRPASVDICSLLVKPGKLRAKLTIRYRAMEVPDDFLVGYGLDYDGYGRNLRDIYTIVK